MYQTLPSTNQSTADLAAELTDYALEILAGLGLRGNSVEVELKLWRLLRTELDLMELRWRRFASRNRKVVAQCDVLQRLVYRAARQTAREGYSFAEDQARSPKRACGRVCEA